MSWRSHAAKVLRGLASTIRDLPPDEARKAISAAYPFGPRSMHPYKMWLSECHRQFPHLYRKSVEQKPLPEWLQPKSDA